LVKQGGDDSVSENCDSTIESVEHELSNSDDDSENSMVTIEETNSETDDDTAQYQAHTLHSTKKSVAQVCRNKFRMTKFEMLGYDFGNAVAKVSDNIDKL
jgi:hypothetical protein